MVCVGRRGIGTQPEMRRVFILCSLKTAFRQLIESDDVGVMKYLLGSRIRPFAKKCEGWGTPFSQWHGLPWRPRQCPSTQQTQADAKDRLACPAAYVVDGAIAGLGAFLP